MNLFTVQRQNQRRQFNFEPGTKERRAIHVITFISSSSKFIIEKNRREERKWFGSRWHINLSFSLSPALVNVGPGRTAYSAYSVYCARAEYGSAILFRDIKLTNIPLFQWSRPPFASEWKTVAPPPPGRVFPISWVCIDRCVKGSYVQMVVKGKTMGPKVEKQTYSAPKQDYIGYILWMDVHWTWWCRAAPALLPVGKNAVSQSSDLYIKRTAFSFGESMCHTDGRRLEQKLRTRFRW